MSAARRACFFGMDGDSASLVGAFPFQVIDGQVVGPDARWNGNARAAGIPPSAALPVNWSGIRAAGIRWLTPGASNGGTLWDLFAYDLISEQAFVAAFNRSADEWTIGIGTDTDVIAGNGEEVVSVGVSGDGDTHAYIDGVPVTRMAGWDGVFDGGEVVWGIRMPAQSSGAGTGARFELLTHRGRLPEHPVGVFDLCGAIARRTVAG